MDQDYDLLKKMIAKKATRIFKTYEEEIYYLSFKDRPIYYFCAGKDVGEFVADLFVKEDEFEAHTVLDFLENMQESVMIEEAENYLNAHKRKDEIFLQKYEAYVLALLETKQMDKYKAALEHFKSLEPDSIFPKKKVVIFESREAAHNELIGLGAKYPYKYGWNGNIYGLYLIKLRDIFGGITEFLFAVEPYDGVDASGHGIFLMGPNTRDLIYYPQRFVSGLDIEKIRQSL